MSGAKAESKNKLVPITQLKQNTDKKIIQTGSHMSVIWVIQIRVLIEENKNSLQKKKRAIPFKIVIEVKTN